MNALTTYPHLVDKFWENLIINVLKLRKICWYVDKSVYLLKFLINL